MARPGRRRNPLPPALPRLDGQLRDPSGVPHPEPVDWRDSTLSRFAWVRRNRNACAAAIPGGGSARPFATESHAMDSRMYLRIALELYLKRAIIGGIERVYEIGRNFRNEGVSFKHSPEFTMLELYQAYADYQDIMRLTEDMIATAARAAVGKTRVRWGDQDIDFSPPWERIPLRTAIAEFSGVDYNNYPDADSLRRAAQEAGLHTEPVWNRGKIMDEL